MAKRTFAQRGWLASTALGSLASMASLIVGATGLSVAVSGVAVAQEHHHHHHHNMAANNMAANNMAMNNNNNNNAAANAVTDPGVRGGTPGAGGPLPGLNSTELTFFNAALARFQEVDSVSGTITGEAGVGLGPRFNGNSCAQCHIQPAVGGGSPPTNNPQVALASDAGATNKIPFFVTANGPIREARFVNNPDGTPDGGVHDLYTITGRSDAPGCNIAQPDFDAARAANNVINRIPISVFGDGLVENISDGSLMNSMTAAATVNEALGISGHFNRSGNDGTITRFGWKAQNKSLLIFAGEAYNVEQGVTNENFMNERENDPHCQFNSTPEDATNLTNNFNSGSLASDFASDIVNFAAFMRLSAAPTPAMTTTSSTTTTQIASAAGVTSTTLSQGQTVFMNIGCSGCHTPTFTTQNSPFTNQSMVSFSPFSDFAVHHMGTGLADRVSQGNAGGDEFRSAPLFGVGQRVFFLHDGRTSDIVQAIQQHFSEGSEANTVINNFNSLSTTDQQALVNFLRSL
jgi:CxxC motif-containing protein (DUF1111 family)